MSSCENFVFVHLRSNFSFSLTDAAFVAFLTFDLVDIISPVVRFEFLFRVRDESSHSYGRFVGDCDALWFEQSCSHFMNIFDVG